MSLQWKDEVSHASGAMLPHPGHAPLVRRYPAHLAGVHHHNAACILCGVVGRADNRENAMANALLALVEAPVGKAVKPDAWDRGDDLVVQFQAALKLHGR